MSARAVRLARLLLVALLAGCAAAEGAPTPREIALGVEVCEYCHMTIDDPDRAAQWVDGGGHAHGFDEPGCLLAWLQDRPAADGTAFLADAGGSGWMHADSSALLRGGPRTSMGFDLVAYRDARVAERAAAAAGGDVATWDDLRREGVKDVRAR